MDRAGLLHRDPQLDPENKDGGELLESYSLTFILPPDCATTFKFCV